MFKPPQALKRSRNINRTMSSAGKILLITVFPTANFCSSRLLGLAIRWYVIQCLNPAHPMLTVHIHLPDNEYNWIRTTLGRTSYAIGWLVCFWMAYWTARSRDLFSIFANTCSGLSATVNQAGNSYFWMAPINKPPCHIPLNGESLKTAGISERSNINFGWVIIQR